ncbi:MarR family winged helix-turn-helix transcriptional regulator [Actinophytocola gossypii]|uniref:MarR family transcriptional regulator n=1 Tax=Actinophytocola gossypii TaxID=2812003 RepID=A0ABT2J9L3_9PSEU|nr:MarR family transcriptional regulator [Actinophytocola gossypii]MCT2584140.1 MarR family transcriptional regulator [Actinophytocola gossypii]
MSPQAHIADIASALVALRRSQTRRALARLAERRGERTGPPDAVFDLLDALADRTERLTVTEAAAALGVDQARASRLAAQAIGAGLARREPDQADGRRSILALTPDGHAALDRISAFRRATVADATADWSADDRAALAELLTRFVRDFAARTEAR